MDHRNKCIIFPHNAKQNEMTILIVVRVTRQEPPVQLDPELFPFRGTRFRAAQSLVFCIVLCCSLLVLWSFFPFRHCIVCQTMTFFLLDIVLSVKL
jgi:hypothetical protein